MCFMESVGIKCFALLFPPNFSLSVVEEAQGRLTDSAAAEMSLFLQVFMA